MPPQAVARLGACRTRQQLALAHRQPLQAGRAIVARHVAHRLRAHVRGQWIAQQRR